MGTMDRLIEDMVSQAEDDGYRHGLQKGRDNCAAARDRVLEALETEALDPCKEIEEGVQRCLRIVRREMGGK